MDNIDKIPFSKLKRMVESIENHFVETPERLDEVELSFEYIIGSCFPNVFEKKLQESLTTISLFTQTCFSPDGSGLQFRALRTRVHSRLNWDVFM